MLTKKEVLDMNITYAKAQQDNFAQRGDTKRAEFFACALKKLKAQRSRLTRGTKES